MNSNLLYLNMNSNLIYLVNDAINNCVAYGEGSANDENGLVIYAEWIDSPNRNGYSIIRLTISENGVIKFSYADYATECRD